MDARIPYEACPLCEGRDMDEVRVASTKAYPLYKPGLPETQRWVRCRACGHEFTDGYLTDEALALLFSDSHPGQSPGQDIETARYVWARTVERVSEMRPGVGGRWLDVGFGSGALLSTAAELGWEVVGLDLREESVRLVREMGFEAHRIELTRYAPAEKFDVVSMADVLEHMPYPKAALRHARGLLREGGVLYLSLPNSDSVLWETLTKNGVNPYFAELEHCHNFGRRRLHRLLEEHGFAPRHYGVSVRYRACIEVHAQKVALMEDGLSTPRAAEPGAPVASPPEVQSSALADPEKAQSSAVTVPARAPSSAVPAPPKVRPDSEARLHLGCGRTALRGWVNIDMAAGPGVDLVVDLEKASLPFADDSVVEIYASHVLEHIHASLPLLQELHRVSKAGAKAVFRVPYGASDDADEDPTHVRRYFWGSWAYFSQPYYWRADYGYRGDWDLEEVLLVVDPELSGKSWQESYRVVQERRNVVREMVATLRAVKPPRAQLRELQHQTLIKFALASPPGPGDGVA